MPTTPDPIARDLRTANFNLRLARSKVAEFSARRPMSKEEQLHLQRLIDRTQKLSSSIGHLLTRVPVTTSEEEKR